MLRDTPNNESVIVEYGFLDSTGDDVEQIKRDYEKYAEAVVRAVANYKNIPYIPVSKDIYIVQKGDTLWDIARKYGLSVSELKELNNLSTNLLKIGQALKVKSIEDKEETTQNSTVNTYTVQKGDNLYSIANKYGIDKKVVYPHSFRHRYAKNFLEKFNDIALLADLLGHESIETTRIYLRRTASEQQKIVDKGVNW